ncbi:MATE family efflux transporter [Lachnospira multipara]|uniref:MATE family efflux transporter n=1 Tax=Lachnospira multipara TaxID=28051 RepID=UPI0003FB3101|nr:MATE family efflux transporter [Lachnospira multipara]
MTDTNRSDSNPTVIDNKENDTNPMGSPKESNLLLSMDLPIVISMLVQAIYNIVDSAFVGFLSEDALSAVSLVFPFQTVFTAINVGIGVGISQHISLFRGEGKNNLSKNVAGQGFLLAFLSAILTLIFGAFFSGTYFNLSHVYGDVAIMGKSYLTIVACFSVGLYLESVFERMLMSLGHTKEAMICQVTGAVVNIFLDPILIFGFGPIKGLGVVGAAIATVFAQILAATMAFIFHKKFNKELDFGLADILPKSKLIKGIFSIGASATVKQVAAAVILMIVNALLFDFNQTAPAVYGAFNRLYVFFQTPSWAIQDVLVILVAYNLGNGQKKRYTKLFKLALVWGTSITVIACLLISNFPDFFLKIFGAKEAMLELGRVAFPILASFLPFQTAASTISAMLQGLGQGNIALFAGVTERFVLPLIFVYLFARIAGLDLVWWAFTLAEVLGLLISAGLLKYVFRRKIG